MSFGSQHLGTGEGESLRRVLFGADPITDTQCLYQLVNDALELHLEKSNLLIEKGFWNEQSAVMHFRFLPHFWGGKALQGKRKFPLGQLFQHSIAHLHQVSLLWGTCPKLRMEAREAR